MYNSLSTHRILSIDALRGITILVMIFVNELAGVEGVPVWMKHMPADADAMTFVDVVFPAFLFIVGMSIPFAINNRIAKGDSLFQLQWHILFRAIGLIVLGVFMVNAEGGYHEESMILSIPVWSLLFYVCVILVWNVYTFKNKIISYVLRGLGVIGLIALAMIFRGGEDGSEIMQPQWWGILGLIGWAYLIACIIYQVVQGNLLALGVSLAACIGFYMIGKMPGVQSSGTWNWISAQAGHATHTSLVVGGIILSLIFFDLRQNKSNNRRMTEALVFAVILFAGGFFLRPAYQISKIWATPTWALYSAGICTLIFIFLYWLIDLKKISGWTNFFKPAASNPLLTYIIPFILLAIFRLLDISWPDIFYQGFYGIIWSIVFAVLVMTAVRGLNKLKIRLQL
jgi:heparan-alpha-glucosaminide N-acetyltransferase